MRPSTEGCTEWSCTYHGDENRCKAAHAEGCPIRGFTGFVTRAIDEGLPECLIVDLQMPEMTGLELQQQLRKRGVQIPTIVITAHYEAEIRERCESAGAIAFLAKPLQDNLLFAAIDQARGRASR